MNPVQNTLSSRFMDFCTSHGYAKPGTVLAPFADDACVKQQTQIDLIYEILSNYQNPLKNSRGIGEFGSSLFPGHHLRLIIEGEDLKLAEFAIELLLQNGYDVNAKVDARGTAIFKTLQDKKLTPLTLTLMKYHAVIPGGLNYRRQANYDFAKSELEKTQSK